MTSPLLFERIGQDPLALPYPNTPDLEKCAKAH